MPRRVLLLALPFSLITGCMPPLPRSAFEREEALRVARSPVVDISQWPDRDSLGALLLKSAAPLVVFDGATLVPLPSCAVAGRFASRPSLASPSTALLWSDAEIRARFPLRDPALTSPPAAPGRPSPPLAVVSRVTEEWSLATVETNALPRGECAKATHVVTGVRFGASAFRWHLAVRPIELAIGGAPGDPSDPDRIADGKLAEDLGAACAAPSRSSAEGPSAPPACAHPLSLTLTPLGSKAALDDATFEHFTPPENERWSLAIADTPPCDLPCGRWLLPGASATLTLPERATLRYTTGAPRPPEETVRIGYVRDSTYPLPWAVTAPLGAGLVAASLGIGLSGGWSHGGTPSSSGSSGVVTKSAEALLGLAALGTLGAVLAGGSLVALLQGPRQVPRFEVQRGAPGSRPRARRAPLTITPSGAIAF